MAAIDTGWILAQVKPVVIQAIRSVQTDLLMRYSEWLDSDQHQMVPPEGDQRTHSDLVEEFLKGQQ